MQEIISENTQAMMDEIETGEAFDKSMLTKLDSMQGEWAVLATSQDSLFGTYSPIHGMFDGLADPTPMSLEEVEALGLTGDDGEPLPASELEALVDRPRGPLLALREQAESQYTDLVDNISLYSSHQRVQNAMGRDTGCNALTDHFGTITDIGLRITTAVEEARIATAEYRQLKTQIQSEIDSFDDNVINILTGRVNNTILANLVRGSGLYDQLDKIIVAAGIDEDAAEYVRVKVAEKLDSRLRDFFTKKGRVNEEVKKINDERNGIFGQISKETAVLNKAVRVLRKLGAANSLSGLFAANECIQTLMGFVATTPFLQRLGRG